MASRSNDQVTLLFFFFFLLIAKVATTQYIDLIDACRMGREKHIHTGEKITSIRCKGTRLVRAEYLTTGLSLCFYDSYRYELLKHIAIELVFIGYLVSVCLKANEIVLRVPILDGNACENPRTESCGDSQAVLMTMIARSIQKPHRPHLQGPTYVHVRGAIKLEAFSD